MSSDQLERVLAHQQVYVPRRIGIDTIGSGKHLGLAVAARLGRRLTVLAPNRSSTMQHPELARLDVVTERSGRLNDGGVVLAWCPTYKVMEKIQHLEQSVVVLVEWIPGEFDAWAKIHQAYNVATWQVMDTGLDEKAVDALDAIVSEGYNGWHDDIARRIVRRSLEGLADARVYDRGLVLAWARRTKSEFSLKALDKILDRFEESRPAPDSPPGSPAITTLKW
ncbi:hypothetical protein AB6N24_18465 [Cellulomonas sp. 179-A 4D5 NHS]|uniref:hypothetical protein n=1 Tax=Cellulomonas sp. 179-A 4D5 NHS TaxID=3142378 RepID=UPI0039A38277